MYCSRYWDRWARGSSPVQSSLCASHRQSALHQPTHPRTNHTPRPNSHAPPRRPQPELLPLLRANIELNNLGGTVSATAVTWCGALQRRRHPLSRRDSVQARRHRPPAAPRRGDAAAGRALNPPFDVVLASDCLYAECAPAWATPPPCADGGGGVVGFGPAVAMVTGSPRFARAHIHRESVGPFCETLRTVSDGDSLILLSVRDFCVSQNLSVTLGAHAHGSRGVRKRPRSTS